MFVYKNNEYHLLVRFTKNWIEWSMSNYSKIFCGLINTYEKLKKLIFLLVVK